MLPDEIPLGWHASGSKLFIWNRSFPATIHLLATGGGRRQFRTIAPADPVGVLFGRVLLTPSGQHHVYRYRRTINALSLAEGLG